MEKEKQTGFTTKAIVLALIMFFVLVLWRAPGTAIHRSIWLNQEAGAVYNYIETQGEWYTFVFMFGVMSFVVIIIAVVNKVAGKVVFNRMETAVITSVIPIVILINCMWSDPMSVVQLIMGTMGTYVGNFDYETYYPLLSPILGPQDTSIYDAMLPAGSAVNWVAWSPTLLWGIAFALSITFTAIFIGLLVRSVWVHVERLTFPFATYQNEIIELTQVDEKGQVKFWKSKYFLIGLIIGLVWMVPTHLQLWWLPTTVHGYVADQDIGQLWPNGPYVLAWWGLSKQVENILQYVPLYVNLMPWAIGWGFLNTIPNMVGLIIGAVAFAVVLPVTAYNAGFLAPYSSHARSYHVYKWYMRGNQNSGFGPNNFPMGTIVSVGILLAVAVYPLWKNRSQFAPILMALFKKPSQEVEAESPISYRLVWIGLIVSFVVWVAAGVAIGVPVLAYSCFAAIMALFVFAHVRLTCETGGYFGHNLMQRWPFYGVFAFLGGSVMVLFGTWGERTLSNMASYMSMTYRGAIFCFAFYWLYRGGWLLTHTSKIAADQKLDLKRVLKIVIPLIVICFVVAFIFDLGLIGMLEINKPYTAAYERALLYEGRVPNFVYHQNRVLSSPDGYGYNSTVAWVQNPSLTVACLAVGFLIIILTYVLRSRFAWFAVGPAGIALGALIGYQMWVSWLVALIIKLLVIRVGGMQLYKEKALPFFIGSLCSLFLVILFGDLGSTFGNTALWE